MFAKIRDRIATQARDLDRDESGEIPIGPMLVIGLIVIPLVLVLYTFGDEVTQWLRDRWDNVQGQADPTF